MKFGENLKNLRKSKKLSQEDLAFKMKVSRQGVSKWETGDAYPEMNNILELCKIFHCHINDLVNDCILDRESLNEEIKLNVVKLKKEQQRKMKGLSKAIAIIAKIGKILCGLCIFILIISMLLFGILIKKLDIYNNEIIWKGNEVIKITEIDNKVFLTINNKVINTTNQKEAIKIKEILQNNSKFVVLGYLEIGFVLLIIGLILVYKMFQSLEQLFQNINKGDTPFTLQNVGYIKKIAYLMIVVTLLPNIIAVIFEIILKVDLNIDFEMFNLVEILFLFSIAYIFQYGYEIQLDSKGKIYGDEKDLEK